MPGRGEGLQHRLDEVFACAVGEGRDAGEGVEGVGQPFEGYQGWGFGGPEEEFRVGDYWGDFVVGLGG